MAQGNRSKRQGRRNCKRGVSFCEVQQQLEKFRKTDELVFLRLLDEKVIQQVLDELGCRSRHRIYTPHLTLAAFVGQAISEDSSCQQAVHNVNVVCKFAQTKRQDGSTERTRYVVME